MRQRSADLPQRPIVVVSQRLGAIGTTERRIESAGAILRSEPLWTLEEIRSAAGDASIVLLGAVEPFDAAALESLPNCVAVVRRGVGVDNVDVEAATRLGIVVANVPDASVEEVSDHAIALLLAIERRIVQLDRSVHAGVWQRDPSGIAAVRSGIRRISELTLGIVGFGRIGRALARKALPLYARILVADPFISEGAARDSGGRLTSVAELLAQADHISLHAPLLPGTRHLLNAEVLRTLRRGAIIVNTSRGGLINEADLVAALDAHELRAGLDVTETEPVPHGNPLLDADRVVLTAHSAASSVTAHGELAERSVDLVVDLLEGRRPASIVNAAVLDRSNLRARWLAAAGEVS